MRSSHLGISAKHAAQAARTHNPGRRTWRVVLNCTLRRDDGSTHTNKPKGFPTLTSAVAFAWANRKAKLEGGVLSVRVNEVTLDYTFVMDGRRLSTDDLVPAVKAAHDSRRTREANDRVRVAKLDAELAKMGTP